MFIMRKLLLLLIPISLYSCNGESGTISVEESEIVRSVYASCAVKAEGQYDLNAQVSGNITAILVEEGDPVDSNQVIMKVDNTSPRLNAENALLALNLAEENYQGNASTIKTLKLQLELAAEKLLNDSLNYYRQKNLWEQNIGSKIELEKKELAFQNAKKQYALTQMQYQQTRNQAQTALRQARNNYEQSLQNAQEFDIKSLRKGKIYRIEKEIGETVSFKEKLAVIGSAKEFFVELEIDQEDIVRIEKDQVVHIKLDAYPERIFMGKLRKVNPIMNNATQTFFAEAEIKSEGEKLYPGLTGEANVIIARKEKALVIPSNYLLNDTTVILENGEPKVIRTGLRSIDQVEIIEGLNFEDVIQKPDEQ